MSRLVRGPSFSGCAVAFIGRRMATLLLLAFQIRAASEDARKPPVQNHRLYGCLEMGQKGHEVNWRERSAGAANRLIFRSRLRSIRGASRNLFQREPLPFGSRWGRIGRVRARGLCEAFGARDA